MSSLYDEVLIALIEDKFPGLDFKLQILKLESSYEVSLIVGYSEHKWTVIAETYPNAIVQLLKSVKMSL